ncbi:MAG: hypothetical protein HY343_02440 [Lentisphaerae bacterium]|nr:hypothetical protein [Lentisphaerota bacterium]
MCYAFREIGWDLLIFMVLPVHKADAPETDAPEWPIWRGCLIRIFGASIVFGGVCWFLTHDMKESLIAASLPWAIGLGCLAISLVWAIGLTPLMLLVGKLSPGKQANKEAKTEHKTR